MSLVQSLQSKLVLVMLGGVLLACSQEEPVFTLLKAELTGIDFVNEIKEDDTVSLVENYYIYNGSGVATGDFNNDSLPDIVFGGNTTASKVYLNSGHLSFSSLDLDSGNWITGVSVVDINQDGLDDIVLNTGVFYTHGSVYVFVNQGVSSTGTPSFIRQLIYQSVNEGYPTQSVFLDYDLDGDLDIYIARNAVNKSDKSNETIIYNKRFLRNTTDVLLRNDGHNNNGNIIYADVSEQAGIKYGGYSLGVCVADLNLDGFPDIYVSNDFAPHDLIYINEQDGRFKESSKELLKHETRNGMGVDISDIDNDGFSDILVVDMLPEDNLRQKKMIGISDYNKYHKTINDGFTPAFIRNTLQLNNGVVSEEMLPFSEIGQLAGVSKTDWSWSPLIFDFDNDGHKDIFISNGFVRDMTDLDFIKRRNRAGQFGTELLFQQKLKDFYRALKGAHIPNYFYNRLGAFKFVNKATDWGLADPSYSNGAAYVDLDNDGDLDLITNNINSQASIYRNNTSESKRNHYLKVLLSGHQYTYGATVTCYHGGGKQSVYHSPFRGYLSSSENVVHFGLGKDDTVDSLVVMWPNKQSTTLYGLKSNQVLLVVLEDQLVLDTNKRQAVAPDYFTKVDHETIQLQHHENYYIDFNKERLLLKMNSRVGPCVEVADVNQDGRDDVYFGAAFGQMSSIGLQGEDEAFQWYEFAGSENFEDADAKFLDIDKDGDLDLYVVSGGGFKKECDQCHQDRLYLNNGNGLFEVDTIRRHPQLNFNGSCVAAYDFNGDGYEDVFIGGASKPGFYPEPEKSVFLINNKGVLEEAVPDVFEDSGMGIVADAVWTDVNGDGEKDLVTVGEWTYPHCYFNNGGTLKKNDHAMITDRKGWYTTIEAADLDADGDDDLILGNIGQNIPFYMDEKYPLKLSYNDYDRNKSLDLLFSTYLPNIAGEPDEFPLHPLDDVAAQVSYFRKLYKSYDAYANTRFNEILKELPPKGEKQLEANWAETVLLENKNGNYEIKELPVQVQFSQVNSVMTDDVNKDGHMDIILGGNTNWNDSRNGEYDASLGVLLLGRGNLFYEYVPASKSGLVIKGAVTDMTILSINANKYFMAGCNDDKFQILKYK